LRCPLAFPGEACPLARRKVRWSGGALARPRQCLGGLFIRRPRHVAYPRGLAMWPTQEANRAESHLSQPSIGRFGGCWSRPDQGWGGRRLWVAESEEATGAHLCQSWCICARAGASGGRSPVCGAWKSQPARRWRLLAQLAKQTPPPSSLTAQSIKARDTALHSSSQGGPTAPGSRPSPPLRASWGGARPSRSRLP
jgi:hypothetical protein